MNSLVILIVGGVLLVLGYRFYAPVLEKLFDVDGSRKTPAYTKSDNRDYIPARHWLVLFGHHFSSIAGAGPVLGPVIAVAIWGWAPAFLWIILGSILIGGVHDFASLMVSIRHDGKSIADIAESVIGRRAKLLFASFIWLALVLVIAIFASSAAITLVKAPEVIIPSFGLIAVAVIVGIMLYVWKTNIFLTTLFGVICLLGLVVLGYWFPINGSFKLWLYILLGYSFFASVLPVNILLQPRDYLTAFLLIFGVSTGIIGIFITHPTFNAPAFISFNNPQGGPVFPMMCVIIACGAISGFHALVSSGTSSKQLTNERDAKKIGFGAMLVEALVAIIGIIAVSAGLSWTGGVAGFNYPELAKGGDLIGAFGRGYGVITKPILGKYGTIFGIAMLNFFVVTTLDTAARIARYIGTELFGEGFKIKPMGNPYINTSVIILFALYLSLGAGNTIWPVFGASNQLISALVLIVVSSWLLSKGKPNKITLIPAIFMLTTTIIALILEIIQFFSVGKYLLSGIAVVLLVLAGIMIWDAFNYRKRLNK